MKLTCVLPSWVDVPSGGFKVVYQIADRLAGRGHKVTVLHPDEVEPRAVGGGRRHRRAGSATRPAGVSWFRFRHAVEVLRVPGLAACDVPDGDALLATGWKTVGPIGELPDRCGRRFFFVQDYEHWLTGGDDQRRRMEESLRQAPSPVAPTRGAVEMLATVGRSPVAEAPLGIELDQFGIDTRPEERQATVVAFPLREEGFKASVDAILALEAVRGWIPELRVETFGAAPRPSWLPPWIGYAHRLDDDGLRALYNRAAVFVLPSRAEGWSLVGAEAMRCGAALVTSTWGRLGEPLRDGEVARVVPPGRPDLAARVVDELIRSHRHRCALAWGGARASDRFGWEGSIDRLERVMLPAGEGPPC